MNDLLLDRETKNIKRAAFLQLFELKVTPPELEKIGDAYDIAELGHRNQQRDDGQPYFNHPLSGAIIMVQELGITDTGLICAQLLHDMIEDSMLFTIGKIRSMFGPRVAEIVQVVTKPKRRDRRFKNDKDRHQFYFQQLKRANVYVKITKLVDRLQNVRTLHNCAPDKRARKLRETNEVYLPLIDDVAADQFPTLAAKLKILFDEALGKIV